MKVKKAAKNKKKPIFIKPEKLKTVTKSLK